MHKRKKPYSDGEMLVKDSIQDVCLKVLGEAAATKVVKVSLSSDTIARRVANLAETMEIQLINQINLAKYYSMQLDKSTEISDMAILLVYVRYEYEGKFKEKFLFCAALPQRTTALEILYQGPLLITLKIMD